MQDTIKSLWNGFYTPANQTVEHCEREKQLLETADKYEDELAAKLNDEARAVFEKYKATQKLLKARELEAAFAKGFSIGMKLTHEANEKIEEI